MKTFYSFLRNPLTSSKRITIIIFLFCCLCTHFLCAQNVGINTDGLPAASTNLLEVKQVSTTNNTVGIYSIHSGAATTGYGLWVEKTGAGTNNYASYLNASGATNNYSLVVPSGGGLMGLGTTTPTMLLDATWNSTTNDNATIRAAATGNARVYGILGTITSTTADAAAVKGSATGNGATFGVHGINTSTTANSAGVRGETTGNGTKFGVWGSANSTTVNASGVFGQATGNGAVNGVYGTTSSTNAASAGVYGEATANTANQGVFGLTSSTTAFATGVYGLATGGGTNQLIGVLGSAPNSSLGVGVQGSGTLGVFGVSSDAGGYGVYGKNSATDGTGVWGENSAASGTGQGAGVVGITLQQSGAGVHGENDRTANGTDFLNNCNKGVNGLFAGGNFTYSFGIFGYANGTGRRSGGTIGGKGGNYGALGYLANNGNYYTVYGFGTAYQTGGILGKIANPLAQPNATVGLGVYGGVMGGWIKGLVYGTNFSGNKYGVYVHGKTLTNDVIAVLNQPQNSTQRTATYVQTSTKVEITDHGKATLQNGKCYVKFNQAFAELLSDNQDVIISLTPLGPSKLLYVTENNTTGFSVIENENGNANINFYWTATGVKKGFENPQISPEILASDFEEKINGPKGIMYNDYNPENADYSIWYDGTNVRFDQPQIKGNIEQAKFRKTKQLKNQIESKTKSTN